MENSLRMSLAEVARQVDMLGQTKGIIPTGYRDADHLMGGFRPGELTLLAGRPGMGRNALVMNLLHRISKQTDGIILFFAPHMQSMEASGLLLQAGLPFHLEQLWCDTIPPREASAAVEQILQARRATIQFNPTSPTINALRWYLKTIPDVKLLVFDKISYLYNEDKPYHVSNADCCAAFRALAREFHIPVLVTTYLDRALERRKNRRPRLKDLEKIGISADMVDQVLFLYRNSYYVPCVPDVTELIVAKQRDGNLGTVYLDWDRHLRQFHDKK